MQGRRCGAGTHNPGLGSTPTPATIEPAVAVWAGVVAAALGWDWWLLRHGHRTLSEVAGGTRTGRTLVAYLACHLLGIGPHRLDPLSWVADRCRR